MNYKDLITLGIAFGSGLLGGFNVKRAMTKSYGVAVIAGAFLIWLWPVTWYF